MKLITYEISVLIDDPSIPQKGLETNNEVKKSFKDVPHNKEITVVIPRPLASSAVLSIDRRGKNKTAGDSHLSKVAPITVEFVGNRISNMSNA